MPRGVFAGSRLEVGALGNENHFHAHRRSLPGKRLGERKSPSGNDFRSRRRQLLIASPHCHPDRSGPAFSCARFLPAGPRSGGTVATLLPTQLEKTHGPICPSFHLLRNHRPVSSRPKRSSLFLRTGVCAPARAAKGSRQRRTFRSKRRDQTSTFGSPLFHFGSQLVRISQI